MGDLSLEVLAVLLILLPGFLTTGLVQALTSRPKRTELDKVIEALLYSFVTYVLFAVTVGGLPVYVRTDRGADSNAYYVEADPTGIGVLALISGGLALAVAFMVTNDFPLRYLRKLRITQRTTRTSVWSDVFHSLGGYVQVELSDGRCIMGWLRYYSDSPEDLSLFLEDAAWVGEGGKVVEVRGAGILLTSSSGIKNVMFLSPAREKQILTIP